MSAFPTDKSFADIFGRTLVAPRARVMYTPTTKAASTTIKYMLASVEGSYRADLVEHVSSGIIGRDLAIHHPGIHGLPQLSELSPREQHNILTSPDWVRLAGVRDPVSRAYSAWEHRILLLKQRRPHSIASFVPDIRVDGRLELVASFAQFAKSLTQHSDSFMVDRHFLPQSAIVRTDAIDYNMLVRVDQPDTMQRIADLLNERTGHTVSLPHLNEGLGIGLERVCDQHTADQLMSVYAGDYEAFGFERRTFAQRLEPCVLSDVEQRLLNKFRSLADRNLDVSRVAYSRTGARYALRQLRKSVLRRVLRQDEQPGVRHLQL